LQALQAKVRNTLGAPPAGAASDAKPAAKPAGKPAPAAK
jgi:hypothetical protein